MYAWSLVKHINAGFYIILNLQMHLEKDSLGPCRVNADIESTIWDPSSS